MARTTFSTKDLDRLRKTSRFAGRFSHAGISSTADVQGSALCPGSTPGAPLEYRSPPVGNDWWFSYAQKER